jgi:nitroreductase/dihydropteridine reductase
MTDNVLQTKLEQSMSIISDLNWRYATKKFSSKKLSDQQVETLLESLRLTASSLGVQPWKFIVIKNEAIRAELVPHSYGQAQISEASHLILLAAPLNYTNDDVDSYIDFMAKERGATKEAISGYSDIIKGYIAGHSKTESDNWITKQAYIALGNLLTVCAVEKIDSCPMEGFDKAKWDEILGLTEMGLRSVVACPVGFRHNEDHHQTMNKVRFPMSDLLIEI